MHASEQTVYLNGEFLPMTEARLSPQDRGFLFGDGVYEVIPVYAKHLFEFDAHWQRLRNSLDAVSIKDPFSYDEWRELLQNLINRHPWDNQFVYLQVTRGIQMQRDHLPSADLTPTVYAYTNPLKPLTDVQRTQGIHVITLDDIRWLRCDIKAVTLLPNIMMKLAAKDQNADDAILIGRNGTVTEGTASNVFVVKGNSLKTPPNSHRILPGITRAVVEKLAKQHQISFDETDVTLSDLEQADEIWLTSSTKDALPVCRLNHQPVGKGNPGPLWQTFQTLFADVKKDMIQQHQTQN